MLKENLDKIGQVQLEMEVQMSNVQNCLAISTQGPVRSVHAGDQREESAAYNGKSDAARQDTGSTSSASVKLVAIKHRVQLMAPV